MSFPHDLDPDSLMAQALKVAASATKDWLGGQPVTEEPLMNRLTAGFTRAGRCDVGTAAKVQVKPKLFLLHRKAANLSDKFGSDLAVTVDVAPKRFRKTAFFQIKISDGFSIRINRKQINDAKKLTWVYDRAFVLAADTAKGRLRLKSAADCDALLKPGAESVGANCIDWLSLGRWLNSWLSCSIGKATDLKGKNEVEPLLDKYVVDRPRDWEPPWDYYHRGQPADEQFYPAKTWLVMSFKLQG